MSLDAGEQQQELLRNTVVAASKGVKHLYLVEKLAQTPAPGGNALGEPSATVVEHTSLQWLDVVTRQVVALILGLLHTAWFISGSSAGF